MTLVQSSDFIDNLLVVLRYLDSRVSDCYSVLSKSYIRNKLHLIKTLFNLCTDVPPSSEKIVSSPDFFF